MMRFYGRLIAGGVACLLIFAACEKELENYERGTIKAKQVEAQINLQALAISEAGFRAVANRYGATFGEIGFNVTGEDQRYSYFLGQDVLKGGRGPDKLPDTLDLALVTENSFVAYAIANLDDDPTLDIWRVDQSRQAVHIKDDLMQ